MNLIYSLNTTNSNKDKLEILKTYCNDKQVKSVLYYAYNPYYTYFLNFKNTPCRELGEPSDEMFNLLDRLRQRVITGHAAREAVENFAAHEGNLIKLICNKDLACGITATSINKILPGHIPVFNLQLAKEVPTNSLTYPLLGQLKYDGVRVVAIVENHEVTYRTRSGKSFEAPHFDKYFSSFKWGVFDGEMVLDTGKVEDRPKISGMINSALHGTPLDCTNVTFYLFDFIPLHEFKKNYCSFTYSTRFNILKDCVNSVQEKLFARVKIAETFNFNSAEEVNKHFENLLINGYEGLILKPLEHKYTFKRSKDWIKVKAVKECELTCMAVTEGTGRRQGGIGALCCVGQVDGKHIMVNVGSGLTDYDVSLPVEDYIGKKITIKYNDIIANKTDNYYSLFLPRFVCIRGDL